MRNGLWALSNLAFCQEEYDQTKNEPVLPKNIMESVIQLALTLKDYLGSVDKPTGQLAAEIFKRYKQLFEECMQVLTAAIVSTSSEKVLPYYIKDAVILELFLRQLTLEGGDIELQKRTLNAVERALNFEVFCDGVDEQGKQVLEYSVKEKLIGL